MRVSGLVNKQRFTLILVELINSSEMPLSGKQKDYARDDSDVDILSRESRMIPPFLGQQQSHSDLGPRRRNSHRSMTSSSSNSDSGSGAGGRSNSESGTRPTIQVKKTNSNDIPMAGGKNIRGVSHKTLMNIRAIHTSSSGNNSVASVHDNQSVSSNSTVTNGGKTSNSASNRSSLSSNSSSNSGVEVVDAYPPLPPSSSSSSKVAQGYPPTSSMSVPNTVGKFTPPPIPPAVVVHTSPPRMTTTLESSLNGKSSTTSVPTTLATAYAAAAAAASPSSSQSPPISSSSSSILYSPPSSSSVSSRGLSRGDSNGGPISAERTLSSPPYKQFDYGNLLNMVQSPEKGDVNLISSQHSLSLSSSNGSMGAGVSSNMSTNVSHKNSSEYINSSSSVSSSSGGGSSNNSIATNGSLNASGNHSSISRGGVNISGGANGRSINSNQTRSNGGSNSRKISISELSASALQMNSAIIVSGSSASSPLSPASGTLSPPPPPSLLHFQQGHGGSSQGPYWQANQKVYEKLHPDMMAATKHSLDLLACESRDSEEEMRLYQQDQVRRGSNSNIGVSGVYQGQPYVSGATASRSYDSVLQGGLLAPCLPDKPLLKVVLVGDSNVGKTSLMHRYFDSSSTVTTDGGSISRSLSNSHSIQIANSSSTGGKQATAHQKSDDSSTQASNNSNSTKGVDFRGKIVTVDKYDCKFQVWDTSGSEKIQKITRAYYKGAHAFGIVYDITNEASIQRIPYWIDELRTVMTEYAISNPSAAANYPFPPPIVLIGNKVDLEDHRLVTSAYVENYARENALKGYVEVSALEGFQVKELMEIMIHLSFKYVSSHPDFFSIHVPSLALSELTQTQSWVNDSVEAPIDTETSHRRESDLSSTGDVVTNTMNEQVVGNHRPDSVRVDRALKPEARSSSCNSLDSFLSTGDKMDLSIPRKDQENPSLTASQDARVTLLRADTENSVPTKLTTIGQVQGMNSAADSTSSNAPSLIVYPPNEKIVPSTKDDIQFTRAPTNESSKNRNSKKDKTKDPKIKVLNDDVGCRCAIS